MRLKIVKIKLKVLYKIRYFFIDVSAIIERIQVKIKSKIWELQDESEGKFSK